MDLLKMSFSGAGIILVIVLVRALALYKLPKKVFLILWGVALARLLIPFRISSPFSVFALVDGSTPADAGAAYAPAIVPSPPLDGPPALPGKLQITAMAHPLDMGAVLTVVWGIGMAVCALWFIVMYVRCRREFQTSLPVESETVSAWLQGHPFKRAVSVRQSDRISAPLSYGVFRPVILLPNAFDFEGENALQYVLEHEYVHILRFDGVTKNIIILAACVHWFNPLVWVMYVLANRDMELTCDEAVIRRLGQEARAGYAGVLIAMVETKLHMTPLGNHFSRTAIEERVASIARPPKASLVAAALVLLLTAGATAVFATSPAIPGWEDEEWADEYRELIACQAAIDYVNGEKMSGTYLLDRQTYMESHVPPDRGWATTQGVGFLEQAMEELGPGETRHFWMEAWDGSGWIEVYAQPDYRVEVYAANGEALATLTSASYEWEYHYTAAERRFAKDSDAVYLEAYRAAERAGITEAKEPPFYVPSLDTGRYYFGSPEKIRQLAEPIRQRLDAGGGDISLSPEEMAILAAASAPPVGG